MEFDNKTERSNGNPNEREGEESDEESVRELHGEHHKRVRKESV